MNAGISAGNLAPFVILLFIAFAICCRPVFATDEVPAGYYELLRTTCYTCHGPDAGGAGDIPALSSLQSGTISGMLVEYREGRKQGTIMNRIAAALTEEDILQLGRALGQGD